MQVLFQGPGFCLISIASQCPNTYFRKLGSSKFLGNSDMFSLIFKPLVPQILK